MISGMLIAISIHAPREGGDLDSEYPQLQGKQFQSTPPARGATAQQFDYNQMMSISIHAPREGGRRQS